MRPPARLRHLLVAVPVALGLTLAGVAVAAPADAAGVVTRTEFSKVHKGDSRAQVERIFSAGHGKTWFKTWWGRGVTYHSTGPGCAEVNYVLDRPGGKFVLDEKTWNHYCF